MIWLMEALASREAQSIVSLISSLGSLGVIVSIWTYVHSRKNAVKAEMQALQAEQRRKEESIEAEKRQKEAAAKSEQQANRSRLTEAYMSIHAHILRMDKSNVALMEQMIRRGDGYVDLTRNGEMTIAIELLYMKLNAFFLEWHYRNLYGDMEELDRTFDHAMRGLATNKDPRFVPLVENFDKIFADFPDAFTKKMYDRLIALRDGIQPEETQVRRVATLANP